MTDPSVFKTPFMPGLESLFDYTSDAVVVYRAEREGEDFVLVGFNKAAEKIEKVTRDEILGRSVVEVFPGVKSFGLFEVFQRVWRTGNHEWHGPKKYEDARHEGWRENFVYKLPSGEIVALYRDISDQVLIERCLNATEKRYRDLVDLIPNGIAEIDVKGTHLLVNDAYCQCVGYSKDELIGRSVFDLPAFASAKVELSQFWQGAFNEQITPTPLQMRLIRQDGTMVDVAVYWNFKKDHDGAVIGLVVLMVDISGQRKTEEQQNLAFRILSESNRWGRKREKAKAFVEIIKNALDIESIGLRFRAGSHYPYYEQSGFSDAFLATESDLCLYEKEGQIVRGIDGHPCLVCLCGAVLYGRTDSKFPYFSQGGSFWTGSMSSLCSADFPIEISKTMRNRCGGFGYESIALIPIRDEVETIGLLQLNDHRKNKFTREMVQFLELIAAYIGVAVSRHDIQEELIDSKNRLNLAIKGARLGLWDWHVQSRQLHLSTEWSEILERPQVDVLDLALDRASWPDYLHPEDFAKIQEKILAHIGGKTDFFESEARVKGRDDWRWLAMRGKTNERDSAGKPIRVTGIAMDITSLKMAEEAIRAACKEREVLLQEIHHRVKNNFQVISSMLALRARAMQNKQITDVMDDAVGKMRAMALVHERLCRSKDLSKVNISLYVEELVEALRGMFDAPPERVSIKIDIDNVWFEIDTAMPVGLIMNELISNAVKYAFPSERSGEIVIRLQCVGPRKYELAISDNGVGMPEISVKRKFASQKTLGLGLVNILVEQLKGSLCLDVGGGVAYKIAFEEVNKSHLLKSTY